MCLLPLRVRGICTNRPGPSRDGAMDWAAKAAQTHLFLFGFLQCRWPRFNLKTEHILRETRAILSLTTIPTAAELSGRSHRASQRTTVTRWNPGRLSGDLGRQARPRVLEGSGPPSGVSAMCVRSAPWLRHGLRSTHAFTPTVTHPHMLTHRCAHTQHNTCTQTHTYGHSHSHAAT